MSVDPRVLRPEDLAALVADSVLRLIDGRKDDQDKVDVAVQLAQALRDGETQGLAERGVQYWYWVAATESALAFSRQATRASARHRELAFRALRLAKSAAPGLPLLLVSELSGADIEEFWKVSLAAQALAVVWLRSSRLAPAEVATQLSQISVIAARYDAPRLTAAVRRMAHTLQLLAPRTRKPRASSLAVRGSRPQQVAERMIRDGRPDLCEPTAKRSALAEIARLAGASGPAAVRVAEFLEAIALADVWPFIFGGPPSGWGSLRGDPIFDSLFYRAAAIGAGRRTGAVPWRDIPALVSGTSTLWLRELAVDLSVIAGCAFTPGSGWRSVAVRLPSRARTSLKRLTAGNVQALTAGDFTELGELLLEPLLDPPTADAVGPRPVTAVLSPRLRCVPLEAFRIGGQQLVMDTLVSVLPSLLAVASRTVPEMAAGSKLRVTGLFDRSLPGAAAEIAVLRDLVRRGKADGVGFDGPVLLRRALENDQWDLLTFAAHGTVRSGVPMLNPPSGTLGLPQLLEWTLPPIINLGACRSAEPGSPVVPLEWVTVALRRGARSVVAARWPVSDYGAARIVSRFYSNLAERRYRHAGHAFWEAARRESERPPWWWAGLGLFGDELRDLRPDDSSA